jgi:hypothetical protein
VSLRERDIKHVTIIDANKDTDRKTKAYRKRIEKTVREILAWPSKFCKVMKSFFFVIEVLKSVSSSTDRH